MELVLPSVTVLSQTSYEYTRAMYIREPILIRLGTDKEGMGEGNGQSERDGEIETFGKEGREREEREERERGGG